MKVIASAIMSTTALATTTDALQLKKAGVIPIELLSSQLKPTPAHVSILQQRTRSQEAGKRKLSLLSPDGQREELNRELSHATSRAVAHAFFTRNGKHFNVESDTLDGIYPYQGKGGNAGEELKRGIELAKENMQNAQSGLTISAHTLLGKAQEEQAGPTIAGSPTSATAHHREMVRPPVGDYVLAPPTVPLRQDRISLLARRA